MSQAFYYEDQPSYSKYDYAQFVPQARSGTHSLTAAIIATAVAFVFTGSAVATRLSLIPDIDTAAAVGPITPYTGMQWQEDAARRSGVEHGKLAVLTPPVYAQGPRLALPSVAAAAVPVSAEVTGGEELAAYLSTYPNAQEAQAVTYATTEEVPSAPAAMDDYPRYVLPEDVEPPAQIVDNGQGGQADTYSTAPM